MSVVQIRRAEPSDADAMGQLHVTSWRETYAGRLPDEMLANLSVASRTEMWRTILDGYARSGMVNVLVAEDRGDLVALASCGRQRDAGLRNTGFTGEISAIYLRRSHQGAGLGRTLMRRMGASLTKQGFASASLWVLRDNAGARLFYERLGGRIVGEMTEQRADLVLAEVAYGWDDLSALSN